ncbi:MAG: hypothetical protein J0I11_21060 [Actinobacteria bacterium]|nr:hypothetical protein [Actinomycetota bacterium]
MQVVRLIGALVAIAGLVSTAYFGEKILVAAGGAGISLGIGIVVGAKRAHNARCNELRARVEDLAKFDFLHARLNQIAARIGAKTVDLTSGEQDRAVLVRQERIAHLSGVEEYRPELLPDDPGWRFWDEAAYGLGHESS